MALGFLLRDPKSFSFAVWRRIGRRIIRALRRSIFATLARQRWSGAAPLIMTRVSRQRADYRPLATERVQ